MEVKSTWKEHDLYKTGAVEELPLSWVWQYWGSDVTDFIEYEDGTQDDYDGLWQKLVEDGLQDPLIIRVGLTNKKMRLESGNHRIQVLRVHGVSKVPVAVQVRNLCGPNAPGPMTDATKVYDFPSLGIKIHNVTKEYMKPSDVFYSFS